ncbi:MAG: adenosylhomocysteinase [Methermicoccaceae archaeon]
MTELGEKKIEWARAHMPVMRHVASELKDSLEGITVGMALHVEAKTAVLVETLVGAGARVAITGCNPLSTQDDVAAALRSEGIECYAKRGSTPEEYYEAIHKVLDAEPDIVVDDGADLIFMLHTERTELLPRVRGGCEETTTGVIRLKAMAAQGELKIPVMAVNNARTKYLFDNRYGTGQSAWDGIIRTTNLLVAGKRVVVAGYGWCGRGVAMRAHGLGAHVIVCEVDPVRALEAHMDGYEVMPMRRAAPIGDIFITTTGDRDVIRVEHMRLMKDGALLANAGHFNVEIDLAGLENASSGNREVRENITEYVLDGKRIYVLAQGRLVNLAAADGHPIEVMDMSFANQALSVHHLAHTTLAPAVYDVPEHIDEHVAQLKLASLGVGIDELTEVQKKYLSEWREGT